MLPSRAVAARTRRARLGTAVLRFGGGDQAEQLDLVTREILPRLKA